MLGKKIKTTTHLHLLPTPVPACNEQGSVNSEILEPAVSEDEIRQNAEAILNILSYIEREATISNFGELSLILGAARISAFELVQSL